MKKFILFGIIAISVLSLLGCPPTDPPPDPPEEKVAHVDYPDWNENKVDDREETLTPKDRVELFSILDYQEKHEDKGWIAKKVDVSAVDLSGYYDPSNSEYDEAISFLQIGRNEYVGLDIFDDSTREWWLGFNQNISNWDVSNVTDMSYMLLGAFDFDQYLASWDVAGKITTDMFKFSTMEYKPDQHPQGCKCGASSSDPRNPYPTEHGTWSHAAE